MELGAPARAFWLRRVDGGHWQERTPKCFTELLECGDSFGKLVKYALNPTHLARDPAGSRGRDKARVFKSVLGLINLIGNC